MGKNGLIGTIALVLVLVGGLNWGLVGLFNLNLISTLLGNMPLIEKLVYILVGVSAIYYGYEKLATK